MRKLTALFLLSIFFLSCSSEADKAIDEPNSNDIKFLVSKLENFDENNQSTGSVEYERDAKGRETLRRSFNAEGVEDYKHITTYNDEQRKSTAKFYNEDYPNGVITRVHEYNQQGDIIKISSFDKNLKTLAITNSFEYDSKQRIIKGVYRNLGNNSQNSYWTIVYNDQTWTGVRTSYSEENDEVEDIFKYTYLEGTTKPIKYIYTSPNGEIYSEDRYTYDKYGRPTRHESDDMSYPQYSIYIVTTYDDTNFTSEEIIYNKQTGKKGSRTEYEYVPW